MLVGGDELAGSGPADPVVNPATETLLAEVPSATAAQVSGAVRAANGAATAWRRTPAADRGELLHGVAAWLRANSDELARVLTLEGANC
jgi:acyl-CoA reductase-like NAD-dependent aldehyde dehydrogenase